MLSYKFNENEYCFDLFFINNNGEQIKLGDFADREDMLIYIEQKYNIVPLMVNGGNNG